MNNDKNKIINDKLTELIRFIMMLYLIFFKLKSVITTPNDEIVKYKELYLKISSFWNNKTKVKHTSAGKIILEIRTNLLITSLYKAQLESARER